LPVTISEVASSSITPTGATITWKTDLASSSQVDYSLSGADAIVSTTLDPTLTTVHSVTISGIPSSMTYTYHAKSSASGYDAVSSQYSFTTNQLPPAAQVQSLNEQIQTDSLDWTASVNKFSTMSASQRTQYIMSSSTYAQAQASIPSTVAVNTIAGSDNTIMPVNPDISPTTMDLPVSFDWRNTPGKITTVKNQGSCGSCWAFANVGMIEARYNIVYHQYNPNFDLSEQEILSCSQFSGYSSFGPNGCNGASDWNAYDNLVSYGGLVRENVFPYIGNSGPSAVPESQICKNIAAMTSGKFTIDTTNPILYTEDYGIDLIKQEIYQNGPVVMGFKVYPSFYWYSTGIYEPLPTENQIVGDHDILLLGWGTDANNRDYWIVKNSWGTDWGENGFFKVYTDARGWGPFAAFAQITYNSKTACILAGSAGCG